MIAKGSWARLPTPIEKLERLSSELGVELYLKRDDQTGFEWSGNKIRKLEYLAHDALQQGATCLITCGGVQSNHARVTAITAARLGLRCILVLSIQDGQPPVRLTGNTLLDQLAGADIRYVPSRDDRDPAMSAAAQDVRRAGGRPYVIPLGASTPLGAAAFISAVDELTAQIDPPDVVIHATSSGGTQAGLVAGCLLAGLPTQVLGISADLPSPSLDPLIRTLLAGAAPLLGLDGDRFDSAVVDVDDTFVGGGYGVPTDASREALELSARSEGLFLDPTYTAKAMAGLIARVRSGAFTDDQTVLFWHTGGQVGLFA